MHRCPRAPPAPTARAMRRRRTSVAVDRRSVPPHAFACTLIRGGYKIRAQEATMTSMAFRRISIGITAAALVLGFTIPLHAQKYVKGERPQQRGYSLAVITEGGKTVWLGGQIATVDDSGKSLAGDFEGQVRQIFKLINATLEKAGGKLKDMVQMTVFITDVRNGDRLTEIRREIFGDNFPGSALITVTGLADPNAKIEIQGYAVIGSK